MADTMYQMDDSVMTRRSIGYLETVTMEQLQKMQPAELVYQLQVNDGTNPTMACLMHEMSKQLTISKGSYFHKPVVSMMTGATLQQRKTIAKLYPEIREFIFEQHEAPGDAVFQANRHISVRTALLQLLRADSAIVVDPGRHEILLDGVRPHEHQFVYRTNVPMMDMNTDQCKPGSRHFVVADICRSARSVEELLRYSRTAEAAELIVVAPYDQRMWTYMGANNNLGKYVFEWSPPGRNVTVDLVKPAKLPRSFFSDRKFSEWSLYVQPFGTDRAYKFTRRQFMLLFKGSGDQDEFVETKAIRNGFAHLSFIRFDSSISDMPIEQIQEQELQMAIPDGCVEIKPIVGSVLVEGLLPGRQLDLARNLPTYVSRSYYDKAIQSYFRVDGPKDLVLSMMRGLHANSARMVYNGAIVSTQLMVDPETMCLVLESVVNSYASSKQLLEAHAARVKIPIQTRPLDYAAHLVSWATLTAMQSPNMVQGAKQVSAYLSGAVREGVGTSAATESEVLAPLRFSDPVRSVDAEKEAMVQTISDYAEDAFLTVEEPYSIEREAIEVDSKDIFSLRMRLREFGSHPVSIAEVQSIYDQLFPGNSTIDPTVAQMQAEKGDVSFVIDVQQFRVSIPLMISPLDRVVVIPSQLRTSIGADLLGSFRSLMRSLMKRNFNRPRPEASGDRREFVMQAVDLALVTFAGSHQSALRAHYGVMYLTVSRQTVNLWAEKHSIPDVLAAATLIEQGENDPSQYRLMPKDTAKPALSLTAQGAVSVGQTIVFHSKDNISLTVGVFTIFVSRLLAFFDTNIRFAYGADEHTSGQWADTYLDIPGTFVEELDIPKFDKSQDWVCFELILYVMEVTGVHSHLIDFWRKATDQATVFSAAFQLTFETMFGNRSGNGGTLAVNCIVLLFAFLDSFADTGIVALLIKGDDSVLVTKRPLTLIHEQKLEQRWGFTMKRVSRKGTVQFCSSIFVRDSTGKYRLVRDLVRLIEKAGRALPVDRPAHYFLDYYVSFADAALAYDDEVLVENLQVATMKIYGREVDVRTLVAFVQYVSSSTKVFLKTLYGLTDQQILEIRNIDEALEVITRVRSTRFVKGKDLVGAHKVLKLTLLNKMMISADWIFEACE